MRSGQLIPIAALAVVFTSVVATPVAAQVSGVREVSASADHVIPIQARLRYTKMIVLPDGEEILDVICGDKDFWVISAVQNVAHVKPAKAGAAVFDAPGVERHRKRHFRRLCRDAEIIEECGEVRIVAFVIDDNPRIDRHGSARHTGFDGVGMAAEPIGPLVNRHIMAR